MLAPQFVFAAAGLTFLGSVVYIKRTLFGAVQPNRVTWGLWALEGISGYLIERHAHVGMAAVMTLAFGAIPLLVVLASFAGRSGTWRIGRFDYACGGLAAAAFALWLLVPSTTPALVLFALANVFAGLPTLRKAWLAPSTEAPLSNILGTISGAVTLLTLTKFTTAGALYPGTIATFDLVMVFTLLFARRRATRNPA